MIALEKKLNKFLNELDDFYLLRPIMAENCNVSLTELDTIYSFYGLTELHMLMDVKMNFMDLEEQKMKNNTEPPDARR